MSSAGHTERRQQKPRRTRQLATWALLVGAVLVAIVAWSPSLRFGLGSTTAPPDRGGAKDFALPTLDGGTWSLASHRGRVVLVNFWATWCPPCRMETPDLVRLQSDYASKAFDVVGINMDEDQRKVAPFVKEYKINYPILLPGGPSAFGQEVSALPTSFLVDRNGRIAREYVGMISETAVRADIDRLLAER